MPDIHPFSIGPRPVALFTHALESDGRVVLTGQMWTDADALLPDEVVAQTRRGMDNLAVVPDGVGYDLTHLVQCCCFLTESERDCAVFNEAYQSPCSTDRGSACKTVTVMERALAEMNCIARHTQ